MRTCFDALRNPRRGGERDSGFSEPTTVAKIRQVALLIDTSTDYSVHVIEGVAQYAQQHRPWNLLLQPRGERERSLMPRYWRPDGVIARVTHHALAADLRKRKVPVVNVSLSTVPGFRISQVTVDERLIGAWAATHLWERGFRHFGYCGLWHQPNYIDRCGPSFARQLARLGVRSRIHVPREGEAAAHSLLTPSDLQRWLKQLPKPIGIFVTDAEDAHNLADACRAGNHHVPDEVAILVGEDDRLLCEISHPPLSAIDLGSKRIGYEAASLLDRMMSRRKPPRAPRFLSPLRVITRHSTDTMAVADRELADAVRFIREHATRPIGVPDILRQLPLSRRSLELRFRQHLGRSPAAEIRRVRFERAKELLASTDLSVPQVAAAAGFARVEVMNRLFQRSVNRTPTKFRQQFHG
jgi:LacI family transcriptional regulator